MNRLDFSRRSFGVACATTAAALAMGTGYVVAARQPKLFVFIPTLVRARALVKLLEENLHGVDITVFGRFADFTSAVETLKPQGALSLPVALATLGLSPTTQGTGKEGALESYVILTPDANLTIEKLTSRTVGIVDVVGRAALPHLVGDLLGLDRAPRVRRVLKVADLLPLFSLKLADAIILPERMLKPFLSSSRLALHTLRPRNARLNRAAVAYPNGNRHAGIERGLRQLSTQAKRALGVDSWESVK